MKSESRLCLDLWSAIRDHLIAAQRGEAALAMMEAFADHGMDARDLCDVVDEDSYLTRAYHEVFGEDDEDSSDDYGYDDE